MQIEKINENQISVILSIDDLKNKNINLHSFMCNSIESQNLFFDILNLAKTEISFNLNNYEVIIEAFSIPSKSSFVLLITRVPKKNKLYSSKTKYGSFKISKSFWITFSNFEDLCVFCNSLSDNLKLKSSLYVLNGFYFLYIKFLHLKDFIKVSLSSNEFSNYIYGHDFILNENAEAIIKDCALETFKKYFV